MENKYYTPQIEEFRVGFEYEYNNGLEYKVCIFEASDYEDLAYNWEDCDFRVKYLDQQDIEECGFKFDDEPGLATIKEHYSIYRLDDYILGYNKEDYQLRIALEGTYYTPYVGIDGELITLSFRDLFYGVVKNKSELKQILKMLGIDGK